MTMIPLRKIKDKNCDNQVINYQNINRFSNFSIDHILNKAGKQCSINSKMQMSILRESDKVYDTYITKCNIQCNIILPIFDWLNYTRYKPPKLPKSFHNGPIKRSPGRLPRVPFTKAQLDALEKSYKKSNYLSLEETNRLAVELQLTNTRVKIWFQNRRAREKKEKQGTKVDLNNIKRLQLTSNINHQNLP